MLPTFYINLDRRPDRNSAIQSQLQQLNIKAQRIQAIDGSTITNQQAAFVDSDMFILRMKRPISQGEIGCALSHRKIWQKILDEKLEYSLVMEDDVIINPALIELLTSNQYKKFDFINLSSNEPYNIHEQALQKIITSGIRLRNHQTEKEFKRLDWNNNWKIYKLHEINQNIIICECNISPALGSGYILSKKAAQHFLLASDKLQVPIDYIWRYSSGMLRQGFLATPLITQRANDSNISGRDTQFVLSAKQKMARLLLKLEQNPRKQDIKRMYG